MHVEPGAYQDKFMDFMGTSVAHGSAKAGTQESATKAQRRFAAQVARDDTMAESIERALEQHPGYKVLHLTGSFHSEAFLGTVERLRMLDPKLKVAVIEPVEVEDPHAPAFGADSLKDGTVLQLVYPNPDSFADGEATAASVKDLAHAHYLHRCKYSPPGAQGAAHPPARSP